MHMTTACCNIFASIKHPDSLLTVCWVIMKGTKRVQCDFALQKTWLLNAHGHLRIVCLRKPCASVGFVTIEPYCIVYKETPWPGSVEKHHYISISNPLYHRQWHNVWPKVSILSFLTITVQFCTCKQPAKHRIKAESESISCPFRCADTHNFNKHKNRMLCVEALKDKSSKST